MPHKQCTKCRKSKPCSEFHPDRRKRDGMQSQCRECQKAWKKELYLRNAEERRADAKRRYHRSPKTEAQKTIKKEYDRKYRASNKSKLDEQGRAWKARNHQKVRYIKKSYKYRRRAKESEGVSWQALKDWDQKQKKVCYWCGANCPEDYHIDHYTPLAKGGAHELENLVISCPTCNMNKNAQDPYEYAHSIGRLF